MAVSVALGKWGVAVSGILLLSILCLIKPITTHFFHDYTIGTVLSCQMSYGRAPRKSATIEYVVDQVPYQIDEDVPLFIANGTHYRVLYNTLWPAEGHIRNMKSIFETYLILLTILLFPWMAFSTSFVSSDEVVSFRQGKLRLEKKNKYKATVLAATESKANSFSSPSNRLSS
jgi:hypothetical protein